MDDNEGIPEFNKTAQPPTALTGCFEIDTGTNFTSANNFLVGLGAVDPTSTTGEVLPAAVVRLSPIPISEAEEVPSNMIETDVFDLA
jgi:hypothetical protein